MLTLWSKRVLKNCSRIKDEGWKKQLSNERDLFNLAQAPHSTRSLREFRHLQARIQLEYLYDGTLRRKGLRDERFYRAAEAAARKLKQRISDIEQFREKKRLQGKAIRSELRQVVLRLVMHWRESIGGWAIVPSNAV